MPEQPTSKDELQALNRSERAALLDAVERMGRERLETPLLNDGWSVKDVLAHVSVWERRILRVIAEASRGESVEWPEPGFPMTDEGVNAVNERDFESHRNDALPDVVAESQASFDAIIACVDAMPEADVMSAPAWRPQVPLFYMIGGNAWEHYREHIDQIEAWLAAQS